MQLEADVARLDDRRAVSPDAFPWTDAGNAERLIARHGDDLLFCHPWSRWLVWDGRRWKIDDTGDVVRRAKGTVREMIETAFTADDRKFRGFAIKSEADRSIRAMLTLAQSERPVLPEQLDADPWLLNVENGTLDLRTGELRPHRREDLLSKLAPVAYDPGAEAPLWLAFLERIMAGRAEMIAFLQRAVGYSLTGSTREQVLFLLHGSGANGKSTYIETLRHALGDYAMQSPAETLLDRREGVPNDIARLRGARLVSAIETGDGKRLAEAMVKQMTGGDTIPARFMRAEWFEFRPEFKLWLATNHLPTVRGTDEAIWRRIRLVEFTVTIPEGDRDGLLGDKLRAELPGILAWAAHGCIAWQAQGLGTPNDVRQATADYRADMDVLGDWIAGNCVVRDNVRGLATSLYNDYRQWCDERSEKPITQTTFGLRLGERGFEKHRGTGGTGWRLGINLRARDGYEPDPEVTSSPGQPPQNKPKVTGSAEHNEQVTSDQLVTSSPSNPPNARTPEETRENPSLPVTSHYPITGPENEPESATPARARAQSPPGGPDAAAPAADDSIELPAQLVALNPTRRQHTRWLAAWRESPARVLACYTTATQQSVEKPVAYFDQLIAGGGDPAVGDLAAHVAARLYLSGHDS